MMLRSLDTESLEAAIQEADMDENLVYEALFCIGQIFLLKGEILEQMGNYDEAIACYENIKRILDDRLMIQEATSRQAQILSALGMDDEAIECLDEFLRDCKDVLSLVLDSDTIESTGLTEDSKSRKK